MDQHDAAKVAISRMGAPGDVGDYFWQEAEAHGENVGHVIFATRGGVTVFLNHTDVTTYGRLRVGWDEEHHLAAWAWEPSPTEVIPDWTDARDGSVWRVTIARVGAGSVPRPPAITTIGFQQPGGSLLAATSAKETFDLEEFTDEELHELLDEAKQRG